MTQSEMHPRWTRRFACLVLAAATVAFARGSARAQQNVPPPPNLNGTAPAANDNGPSLEETMKFIQDKLSAKDANEYTYINSAGEPERWSIEQVSADARTCTFKYQSVDRTDFPDIAGSDPKYEHDLQTGSFKDVASLDVSNLAAQRDERTIDPSLAIIRLKADRNLFQSSYWIDPNRPGPPSYDQSVGFTIRDEDLANRVAKAITHAVELCQAKPNPKPPTNEPF